MRLLAILLISMVGSASLGQSMPAQATPGEAESAKPVPGAVPRGMTPQQWQQLPPQVRLGIRGAQVQMLVPLIDRVVLVPDAATYLDELGKWSLKGRWPVLIEDDLLTPMFVRKFKPAQIIRRESIGALPESKTERQKKIEEVLIHAFDGEPNRTLLEVFAAQQLVPPGVVITSADDPAWTAAVALAAGHGQPLLWMDESVGGLDAELSDSEARALAQRIEQLVRDTGYEYAAIGDDIDAVALCRLLPARLRMKLIGPARPQLPADADFDGPIAITDYLCRHPDLARWAYAGWIWGDETRCAYMAMCSLFLERDRAWLFNGYPTTGAWESYATDQAADVLNATGFGVKAFRESQADFASWRRNLRGGLSTDVVLLNTKGNNDFFDLTQGQGRPDDVPVLNSPVALHIIHSWSMQRPELRETVGGRWLANGAYAAVGSIWEPYLYAFVPPTLLTQRMVSYVPFLVSARWWSGEGPLWMPWRVITIGDPLMLVAPPEQMHKARVQQPAEYGVDLAEAVKVTMRASQTDETGKSFGQAIAMLDLLGKDDIAIKMWLAADQKGHGTQAARAALGPLFRIRNEQEFMKAWDQLPAPDDAAEDMLRHLQMP